jgi:N-carbamoyl-L-amino-acid hydrolase
MTPLDPTRTIAELKELRALTGDDNGAQRVAFTPVWVAARAWLRKKLEAIGGLEIHTDAAGNLWATLRGESERALLIGGHIDSVPNGGWLDGSLDVLAGVEILRRIHAQYAGRPPRHGEVGRLGRRGRRMVREEFVRFLGVRGLTQHG